MRDSERWFSCLAIMITLLTLFLGVTPQIAAQGTVEDWSSQTLLSEEGVDSYHPAIVADPSGTVHVVWVAKLDEGSACSYDTLMYATVENGMRSSPIEALVSPDGRCVSEPTLAFAPSGGCVHVVWSDLHRLYHSSARADQATDPRAWGERVELGLTNARRPHLVIDKQGHLHLACHRAEPYREVVYAYSDDGGNTWATSHRIASAPTDRWIERVELATGADNALHIVWTEEYLPGTFDFNMSRGGAVCYARSTDGGRSWSQPLVVDAKDERYQQDYGAGEIAITTADHGEVHLVWAGAPAGHRWHQWSSDGGLTWREAQLVAPIDALDGVGLRFFNNGLDLAPDSAGRVHLLSSSDHLAHVVWDDHQWSAIDAMLDYNPVWCRMAIGNGNVLHVVGATLRAERDKIREAGSEAQVIKSVWYTVAETAAPRIAPQAITPIDTGYAKATEGADAAAVTTPRPTAHLERRSVTGELSPEEQEGGTSRLSPLLLGAASAAFLLVVVSAHRLSRGTR